MSPVRAFDLTAECLFRLVSQSGPELQANSQAGVLRILFRFRFLAELVLFPIFSRSMPHRCFSMFLSCYSYGGEKLLCFALFTIG